MAGRKTEERVTVTPQDLAISNALSIEALVRALIERGVVSEADILKDFETVKREWAASQKKGG